jgi:glycosyltransferase involved in cell wall biosynthesis
MKKLAIMGIRGIPAKHGGFETFAEFLALYLVDRGWDVTVYCHEDGDTDEIRYDDWQGVKRITMTVKQGGALGTMVFDWKSIRHLLKTDIKLVLTLGYNTATFCTPYRFKGITNLINMDGIEWKRDKWRPYERAWLWLNERYGCLIGNHLVADHPDIKKHLATRVSNDKITMIPYGAPEVLTADATLLQGLNVKPGRYAVVIARPEPENSVLDIVKAFSRKQRGYKLVMLGKYEPEQSAFHKSVLDAASDEVLFPGAIYDRNIVEALRFHARFYIHGHRVGGTNPSLVEALGAGSAVLAHDNDFNRWVAGSGAHYFKNENQCAEMLETLWNDDQAIASMQIASRARFNEALTWPDILAQYESLLLRWNAKKDTKQSASLKQKT